MIYIFMYRAAEGLTAGLFAVSLLVFLYTTSNTIAAESIVIDAGHGESAKGQEGDCKRTDYSAEGACIRSRANEDEWPEGVWTLEFSRWIYERIAELRDNDGTDVEPFLTRSDEQNMGFDERISVAKKHGANILVSVHFNNSDECPDKKDRVGCDDSPRGVETFYDGLEPAKTIAKTEKFCGALRIVTQAATLDYYKKHRYTDAIRTEDKRITKPFRSINKDSDIASRFFTQIRRAEWRYGRPLACLLEIEFMEHKHVKKAFLQDGELGHLKPEIQEIAHRVADFLVNHAKTK